MTTEKMFWLAPVAAAMALAGCATEPTMTEARFGDAVRQTMQAQVYDQSTLSSPSADTIDRTDGQLLEGALETYRGAVADPASVGGAITINVGG